MTEHSPRDISHAFAARLEEALREARTVVDPSTYVPWRVFELPPGPFDRRSTPTLVLECDGAMHRVRDYPAEWRALPDAELLALRTRS